MATMTEQLGNTSKEGNEPSIHYFHAKANVLSGHLDHPIKHVIEPHAQVEIKNSRRSDHLTEGAEKTSLEGLISYSSALSRVSGVKVEKKEQWETDHTGWVTLSTSVIEDLNVFEIITADRVVSQVSTEHPFVNGHVPKVTFVGTQFKNLEVSGFPVSLTLDLGICGNKPEGDRAYLDERSFLETVRERTAEIDKMLKAENEIELPKDLKNQYADRLKNINRLIAECGDETKGNFERSVTCSLVKSIGKIPIPGVKSYGNVLMIPNFGWVALAEVEVGINPQKADPYPGNGGHRAPAKTTPRGSNYFRLKMLDMNLGCVGGGNVAAGSSEANGHHQP